MRVVLDTNILLSALISRDSPPVRIYQAWRKADFDLITTGRFAAPAGIRGCGRYFNRTTSDE